MKNYFPAAVVVAVIAALGGLYWFGLQQKPPLTYTMDGLVFVEKTPCALLTAMCKEKPRIMSCVEVNLQINFLFSDGRKSTLPPFRSGIREKCLRFRCRVTPWREKTGVFQISEYRNQCRFQRFDR